MRKAFTRLLALHGTARGIAGGFTLGMCLSLVPIPVVGMVVALTLAPLLRLNPPATYLGTAVVNPLTGPFIYFSELALGMLLLGRHVPPWEEVRLLDASGWWSLLSESFAPFFLGAAVVSLVAGLLALPSLWWLVARYQARSATPSTPT